MGNENKKIWKDFDPEETTLKTFRKLDKDGSGAIDEKEWTAFAHNLYKDRMKYHNLPFQEGKDSSEKEFIAQVFRETDVNGDGKLSLEEFVGLCQRLLGQLKN